MRQSRIQSIFAIFFLVVVLFPLTVKDMHYHVYGVEHSAPAKEGLAAAQNIANDCLICDYEFVFFLANSSFFSFEQVFPSTEIAIYQPSHFGKSLYLLQLLRAPPAL